MLDRLDQQPPDALLALIKLHDADPRADKIDLGVGVYRTGQGETPVFGAIKAAEQKLVKEQDSKSYLGPEGDMGFVHALMPYIFDGEDPTIGGRIDGMQTPGGTGAVRLALALAKACGVSRILMGIPSWPNHAQIIKDLGLELVTFAHATDDGAADLAALEAALSDGREGDAVLLHGCCHNPTGVDYTPAQWDDIAQLLEGSPVLPIVDLAYQGLGHGMDEDAYGARRVIAAVPEALIAYSCDKNFGLYRDRVGALYAMTADTESLARVMSNGYALARAAWSMPPDHGAAAVRLILEDEKLTAMWQDELDQMRARIRQVRDRLGTAGQVGSVDLTPLAHQNGMFATLPLDKDQIAELRSEHGIYMAGSGRINVAGLTMDNIEKFIHAVSAVAS
ncbi:aminotransferase class I/II-fold pyridoxal phosphate-dependent enzyme [Altererythrobacter salegens]|uniref:Aminotransferase class I/II-fold pyridoxal phosphate-dependent enzyme n=1 Tax=Croceibacterium salegens TaxID=1737568 RepID=A0A6I4SZM5_9SPHN|nr:aromatic amino acid transaminase [Croceibacterium salegens]MXO61323.1 aminotransferase class I/II-fold pyridoxal phosphate-dependent enzyme [Croceibacterium salegens]